MKVSRFKFGEWSRVTCDVASLAGHKYTSGLQNWVQGQVQNCIEISHVVWTLDWERHLRHHIFKNAWNLTKWRIFLRGSVNEQWQCCKGTKPVNHYLDDISWLFVLVVCSCWKLSLAKYLISAWEKIIIPHLPDNNDTFKIYILSEFNLVVPLSIRQTVKHFFFQIFQITINAVKKIHQGNKSVPTNV